MGNGWDEIRSLERVRPAPPAVMKRGGGHKLWKPTNGGLPPAYGERGMERGTVVQGDGGSVVSMGEAAVARRVVQNEIAERDDEQDFGAALRQSLDYAEKYLRYAGTLKNAEGEEYLGWGDDRQLWTALLWAMASACRKRCKVADHKHGENDDPDEADAEEDPAAAGKLAWNALGRLWIFAVPGGHGGSRFGEGSGKSYLAELVDSLCPNPTREVEPTGPGLARMLGVSHDTPVLDESGLLIGGGQRKTMVRTLLLDGFTRGGNTTHAWGKGQNKISTFGPVIVAANASLAASDSEFMAMLISRFMSLEVIQAPKGFRPPRLTPKERRNVKLLRQRFLYLMGKVAGSAEDMSVGGMPVWMSSRTADAWEPLFIVAALAGGEWVSRVVECADWVSNGGREKARKRAAWKEAQGALEELGELGAGGTEWLPDMTGDWEGNG